MNYYTSIYDNEYFANREDEYLLKMEPTDELKNNVVIVNWILNQNDEDYDGIYEIRFDDELNCVFFKSWEMTK